MSKSEIKQISLKRFLSFYLEETKTEKRFCFILGAGASRQSGIPTGGELAKEWMDEIEKARDKDELIQLDTWKKEKGINENNLAEHYSEIYEKRFEIDPELGYVELERLMDKKEPSCGYSVLSQILADTKNNVVITTNFDSLTEDALFIYTQMKPIVCGHESLASFARPMWQRPLIIKVHRDVLFGPKSSHGETESMDAKWTDKLNNIFQNFSPIVIGYGGNDGSLMGLLEKIEKIPGIYWCYRKDSEPNDRIKALVGKHEGRFIPIDGFDEMMIQLNGALGYGLLDDKVAEVAKKRVDNYRKQYDEINKKAKSVETEEALKNIVPKTKRNWWHVQMEANAATDNIIKQLIYEKGIIEFPESGELAGNYAVFLEEIRKEYDKAEVYYKKALGIEPSNVNNLGNYAAFLHGIRKDYDKAEEYYKKVLEIEPNNSYNISNYAAFLGEIRKDIDKADEYYKKAFEVNPKNDRAFCNYAIYLQNSRKDYDKAEEYYKKALEIEPNNVISLLNYADFLIKKRKDYDKAEECYKKALEIEPSNVISLVNYAGFLKNERKDYNKAEEYYKKGLETESNNVMSLGDYAVFLTDTRKDYAKAEVYYKKALEIDPNDANSLSNYAQLMLWKEEKEKAEVYIDKAFSFNPDNQSLLVELWFYRYAHYAKYYEIGKQKLEELIKAGAKSEGWNLKPNIEIAKKDGHPSIETLERFAKEITGL